METFPSGITLSYGLMQKYYNQTVLKIIEQGVGFTTELNRMDLLTEIPFIGTYDKESPFETKLKHYFFGVPCLYNPLVY